MSHLRQAEAELIQSLIWNYYQKEGAKIGTSESRSSDYLDAVIDVFELIGEYVDGIERS